VVGGHSLPALAVAAEDLADLAEGLPLRLAVLSRASDTLFRWIRGVRMPECRWGHGGGAPVDPSATGVVLLASIALGLAVLLGVVGYFFVGFGMATTCTDRFVTGDGCESLYHWLNAGAIGQSVIAVTAVTPHVPFAFSEVPQPHRVQRGSQQRPLTAERPDTEAVIGSQHGSHPGERLPTPSGSVRTSGW